eukprot:9087945-Alexandrium_andersonii.AAC.1
MGFPWPTDLVRVKCVYLAKGDTFAGDPLQYRGLLVMAALYRLWARSRLFHLDRWVRDLMPEQAHAGVKGK